jgi:hypothetical protein
MATIWDLIPASAWPMDPFLPPSRSRDNALRDSPLANDDPYRRMYENAKRAHDLVTWLVQPPTMKPQPP